MKLRIILLVIGITGHLAGATDPYQSARESGQRIEGWRSQLRAATDPKDEAERLTKLEKEKLKSMSVHERDSAEIAAALADVMNAKKAAGETGVLLNSGRKPTSYIRMAQTSDFNDRQKAAKFGYEYDGGDEVYTAKGALVIGYFNWDFGAPNGWNADYWIGNDFDLSTNKAKNPGKITNRFAMLVWKKRPGVNPDDYSLSFLPALIHEANRNFKTKTLLGQFMAEPAGRIGGVPMNLNVDLGTTSIAAGPQLGFEVGSAVDKVKESSPEDGGFHRGVFRFNVRMWPGFAGGKLMVFADNIVRFLSDDDFRHRNLFKAGFEYEISKPVSLSLEYSIGRDTPTFEQNRKVSSGIGLKF